jgi:glycosyltransferase involved in cell wall biosynthesis
MADTILFFAAVAVVWLALTVTTLRGVRAVKTLPPLPAAAAESRPRVTVIVAARNEEARIETTVRRLVTQRGVELEVCAVDDRSTDRTGEILRRVAAEDARLKVRRVDALPAGWLGKCHACHLGAQAASGEWLLFTDGDVWMKLDVIARAVAAARAEGADHVCLLIGMSHGTLAGQACHLIAMMSVARKAARLDTGRPDAYMGIGAFNLVRAAAYRDAGGHVPLRMTVCDDWMLGLLLRRAGGSARAFLAGADVVADWFATPFGMVRALEKNYFAARDYRLSTVLL